MFLGLVAADIDTFPQLLFSAFIQRFTRCAWYSQLLLLLVVANFTLIAQSQSRSDHLLPVSRSVLCITEGDISESAEQLLTVNTPKMRAYVNGTSIPEAEVRFTFLGATGKDVPLGSGEMRRQFGLKLLAQDACNLVYVMWRIEPESKLVVSVKSNPGQHTSPECGNRGYRNIKPLYPARVPAITAGVTHTLHAVIIGEDVRVTADGATVWQGSIGPEASRLQGPVGIRSDNARLTLALRTQQPRGPQANTSPGCNKDAGE
jgi:hypothetical protein